MVSKAQKRRRSSIVPEGHARLAGATPKGYARFLSAVKERIRNTQVKAALSANQELIRLYWDIGHRITERQEKEGWGSAVIERLAGDLQKAFPGVEGFSTRNIWRMRAFYLAYSKNLPQAVAEIPWGHNVILLEKLKDPVERLSYAQKIIEHGWSRAVPAEIRSNLPSIEELEKELGYGG